MKINLLILLLAILSFTSCAQKSEVKQVTSAEALQLISENKNLIVLDVRTPMEFESGHIKGAINININDPDAFPKIDKLDHNAEYLVHCRTNHRSNIAVKHMEKSGFKSIFQMSDGYNGWNQNGLPEVNDN